MTNRFYLAKMSLGQILERGGHLVKLFDNRFSEGKRTVCQRGDRTDEVQVYFWLRVKRGLSSHKSGRFRR